MGGIVGILGPKAEKQEHLFQKMVDAVRIRGEITELYKQQEILTASCKGNGVAGDNVGQPVFDTHKTKMIIYDGKLFNYAAIKQRLENKYWFKTTTDAEVILYTFIEYGTDCVTLFEGQFAFVIYDLITKSYFCARDRIGIIPFYYIQSRDNHFYFASNIKSLTHLNEKITALFPGRTFSGDDGVFHYYKPRYHTPRLSQQNIIDSINTTLVNAVKTRVVDDVPLGVLYSGGLDSSIILMLAKQYHNNVTAFTIESTEETRDIMYAKRFCKEYDIKQVIIKLSKKDITLAHVEEAVEISELNEYPAVINAVFLHKVYAKMKKAGIKIALCGAGSDELFGGHRLYTKLNGKQAEKFIIHRLMDIHRTELQRIDRISTTHGIETRFPYLDTNVIDTALGLSPDLKIGSGFEKWGLREAFRNILPPYIINKPKTHRSQADDIYDWMHKYKIFYSGYYNKCNLHLHDTIKEDFTLILEKNNFDLDKSQQKATRPHTYNVLHYTGDFMKSLVKKRFMPGNKNKKK